MSWAARTAEILDACQPPSLSAKIPRVATEFALQSLALVRCEPIAVFRLFVRSNLYSEEPVGAPALLDQSRSFTSEGLDPTPYRWSVGCRPFKERTHALIRFNVTLCCNKVTALDNLCRPRYRPPYKRAPKGAVTPCANDLYLPVSYRRRAGIEGKSLG